MALPVWKLHVITRCEPLQALLSTNENATLATALFQPGTARTTTTSGARHQRHACDALVAPAALAAAAADAHGGDAAQSNHLERWKQWKLDDAHIQRLTSAQGVDVPSSSSSSTTDSPSSPPLAFLSDWITNARFFARGKRGVLYAGELQSSGAGVVVKLGAASVESNPNASALSSVDAEAKWLRVMNRMGLGAQLVASGPGWFICERLEGQNVVDFLGGGGGGGASSSSATTTTSHANARWVLREMLCQCFAMDLMGINKEEMTHPHRHIIIHTRPATTPVVHSDTRNPTQQELSAPTEWKCTFVDFEKCVYTRKPKNVTQLCQFLSSPRMVALFGAKGVAFEIQKLRLATKKYKQSPQEHTFGELMRVFGL